MRARHIAIVAVAILATACSPASPARQSPSRMAAPIPKVVAERSPLPSCGVEIATTPAGPWNPAARKCFWSAYQQGRPSEFVSTRPTIEGDPITTIYRVVSAGKIEVFMDTTQDRYSEPAGWWRFDCKTLSPLETPAEPDFVVDDSCTQTAIR